MQQNQLEEIGLNKNESKVYLCLLHKGSAIASDLVKITGVHRNIVYDNLNKLVQKGLVSYINTGTKKQYTAQKSDALLSYLEVEQQELNKKREKINALIPEIQAIIDSSKSQQDATLYCGKQGIKKIILDTLESDEYWIIGVSNASIEILGEHFWKNFNVKRKSKKIKENLLVNADFKNTVNIQASGISKIRNLPNELSQVTEIIIFNQKVALIVYSEDPIGVVIENPNVATMFKQQFSFLWKLGK